MVCNGQMDGWTDKKSDMGAPPKNTLQKKSCNSKLKEKCYINERSHLATEKIFVLHHSFPLCRIINGVKMGHHAISNIIIQCSPMLPMVNCK